MSYFSMDINMLPACKTVSLLTYQALWASELCQTIWTVLPLVLITSNH